MQFEYQINSALHDEHQNTLAYLETLEAVLLKHRPDRVPNVSGSELQPVLWQLIPLVEEELIKHFSFEEEAVFPILQAAGDTDITTLLTEEHRVILPIGERLMALVRQTKNESLDDASWEETRRLGLELVERLVSHIQKEEMGLLPMMETLIDEEQDTALREQHMAMA